MEHLKEKDFITGFYKRYAVWISSQGRTSLITKIMAPLHYPFCDSANNSLSLLVY